MTTPFYSMLKKFIWPRYREEGPPSYINSILFDKEFVNSEGQIREPAKSVLELVVLGYRPVTTSSILSILVENQNKPMYGAQLGKEMEKRFRLPKGWFTKTRYYDNRVGKLLKILCRLDVLQETEIIDSLTKRRYVGYFVTENIYPTIRERMLNFVQGGTLSIFGSIQPLSETEQRETVKRCMKCQSLTTSSQARYCELCGTPLNMVCPKCKKENSLEYAYCLYCGEKLTK